MDAMNNSIELSENDFYECLIDNGFTRSKTIYGDLAFKDAKDNIKLYKSGGIDLLHFGVRLMPRIKKTQHNADIVIKISKLLQELTHE